MVGYRASPHLCRKGGAAVRRSAHRPVPVHDRFGVVNDRVQCGTYRCEHESEPTDPSHRSKYRTATTIETINRSVISGFLAVAKVLPVKIFEIGQAGSALVSPLSGKCKIACYQVVPSSPGITHRPSAATRPITMLS